MAIILGLGSNIGDREWYLSQACLLLEEKKIKILQKSSIIETEPFGDVPQDNFFNQIIEIQTTLTPFKLLEITSEIEIKLERKREIHWGPRTIDIDILIFNEQIVNSEQLVIPHPGLHEREFVLTSLVEKFPFYIHPLLRKTFSELLDNLNK